MDKLTINLEDYVFTPVQMLGGHYCYFIEKVTDILDKGVYEVLLLGYFSNNQGVYSFVENKKVLVVKESELIIPGKKGHEITTQLLKNYLEIKTELLNYSINGMIV